MLVVPVFLIRQTTEVGQGDKYILVIYLLTDELLQHVFQRDDTERCTF